MFAIEKFSVYWFGAGVYEFGAEVMKPMKIFHSIDSSSTLVILLCGLKGVWIWQC